MVAPDRNASWGNVGRATSIREILVGGVRLEEIRNMSECACSMAEKLKRLWPNLAQISDPV